MPPEDKNKDGTLEAGSSGQNKVVELLSSAYKRHGLKLGPQVLKMYAELASGIFKNPKASEEQKGFVADYLETISCMEADRLRPKDDLQIELKNLPETGRETIKLYELVVKPEVFDGEKPKPRRWLQEYNEAIVANGWTEKLAIKYLPTFLTVSERLVLDRDQAIPNGTSEVGAGGRSV